MSKNKGTEIRIFCHDQDIVDWWRDQPKGARSAILVKMLRRGIGASDEELENICSLIREFNNRLDFVEQLSVTLMTAVNNLDTQVSGLSDDQTDLNNLISTCLVNIDTLAKLQLQEAKALKADTSQC